MKKVLAKITSIKQETPTVKSFVLNLNGSIVEFLPGQWLDLYAFINNKNEVGGYTIISTPENKAYVEIAVKYSAKHKVTRFLHEEAQIGDSVDILGGDGNFFFQKTLGDNIVLIAGGIGITPILSIMRYIRDSAPEVNATLLYSASTLEELAFREEFEEMEKNNPNIKCIFTLTREDKNSNWQGNRNRIDLEFLKSLNLSNKSLYYICGPQGMIDDICGALKVMQVSNSLIHYEKWW